MTKYTENVHLNFLDNNLRPNIQHRIQVKHEQEREKRKRDKTRVDRLSDRVPKSP